MTSKEMIEEISWIRPSSPHHQEMCEQIKQDLERLEKLEKENQELKETNNIVFFKNNSNDIRIKNIINENAKLKNAIEIFKGFSLGLTMYGGSETSYGVDADNSIILTKEQYELLKEVLKND